MVQMQVVGIPKPVRFLERHDLVISKLVAGREKGHFAVGRGESLMQGLVALR
jgi:hypothetical protein